MKTEIGIKRRLTTMRFVMNNGSFASTEDFEIIKREIKTLEWVLQ